MPEKLAAIDRSRILKFGGDADSPELKEKYFEWLARYGEARLPDWLCWDLATLFPRQNASQSWFVKNGGSGPSREEIEAEQKIQAEIAGTELPTPPAPAPAVETPSTTVVNTTPTPPRTKPPGRPKKTSPIQDGPVARGEVQQAIKNRQLETAGK